MVGGEEGLIANGFGGCKLGAHVLEHGGLEELDGVRDRGEGGVERVAGDAGGAGGVREYFTAESDVIMDEDIGYIIEKAADRCGHDGDYRVAE